MAKLSTRRFAPIGVAALIAATTAIAGATGASAAATKSAAAAALPTYANGLVAYDCIGYNNIGGNDGWVTKTLGGGAAFAPGSFWGPYYGGVNWSADGTEMTHDAAFSSLAGGGRDTAHTVFLSEANADYPWQDSNYENNPSDAVDTDTTFTPDGRDVLFTRTDSNGVKIEDIAAAGGDPPFELPQPAGANSQPTQSVNGDIAFVNIADTGVNAGVPWVWILPNGSNTPTALQAGTLPAFSPDGTRIAFANVARTAVSLMTTAGASVTAVGPSTFPGTIKDFAYSPDGTTFVFGLAVGKGSLSTAPVSAGSALTGVTVPTCLTSVADQVSWQGVPTGASRDKVVRLWGSTRENTSVSISHATFPTAGTADAVVLADSYHFPDGLSGTPLATFVHGPLLLTPGTQAAALPAIKTEIGRVLGSFTKPIYILGGTGSVSAGIETNLNQAGYTNIHRLSGANRYLTSLAIANAMGSGATAPQEILLATGTDFPDGLSAGAAAASYWPGAGGGVVLLTNGASMLPETKAYIDSAIANEDPNNPVFVTTVGGLADKAWKNTYPGNQDQIPCVGIDRYETSACVAEVHFGAQPAAAIAAGTSFPDALSGGAFAGSINAPLLLAPPTLVGSGNEAPYFLYAASGAIATGYIFGGTGVITLSQQQQLQAIIGLGSVYSENPTSVLTAAGLGHAKADGAKASPVVKQRPRTPRHAPAG